MTTTCLGCGADSESEDDETQAARRGGEPRTAFSRRDADGAEAHFAAWNAVLFQDTPGTSTAAEPPGMAARLLELQRVALEHTQWGVVMSSGGHFAAAVFRIRRERKTGAEWSEAILHKTFHKYERPLQPCV